MKHNIGVITEKPILFSGSMVQSILEDYKTQTRRVLKVQPESVSYWRNGEPSDRYHGVATMRGKDGRGWAGCGPFKCPYIPEGLSASMGGVLVNANTDDKTERHARLWVKETFQIAHEMNVCHEADSYTIYRATDPDWETTDGWKWKPSIFMPRKASRITLEILSVRVERLQEISDADALAEGIRAFPYKESCGTRSLYGVSMFQKAHGLTPRIGYEILWESINGKGSWEKNPWVWVIGFKRIKDLEVAK